MAYEVSANIGRSRKRTRTTQKFRTRAEAQKYADDTNKYRPGANARVVKR